MKIKNNMLNILIATNNDHKINEYKNIFKKYDVKIYSLKELNIDIDPEENGKTYFENALIKAKEASKFTNYIIVSDDSGIEIEALGKNNPGIYSSRFIDKHNGQINTIKYLEENALNSKAKFHCSLVVLNIEDHPLEFIGEVKGRIVKHKNMTSFGYDPIFKPRFHFKTYSELPNETKNKISHRYRATRKFVSYLKRKALI